MRRASSRGAEPKTSEVTVLLGSGSANQRTKPSIPAWATRVIQERCSALSRLNQECRSSISAIVAVVMAPVAPESRLAMVLRVLAEGSNDLLIPRVVAAIG